MICSSCSKCLVHSILERESYFTFVGCLSANMWLFHTAMPFSFTSRNIFPNLCKDWLYIMESRQNELEHIIQLPKEEMFFRLSLNASLLLSLEKKSVLLWIQSLYLDLNCWFKWEIPGKPVPGKQVKSTWILHTILRFIGHKSYYTLNYDTVVWNFMNERCW